MASQTQAARALASVVVAATAWASWRDNGSTLAAPLRAREPVAGLLSVRFKGQGRVVPPALYFICYGPAPGTLDLVLVPPSTRIKDKAAGRRGKTLADIYQDAYLPDGDMKRAQERMRREALRILREGPAWRAAVPERAWMDLELPSQFHDTSPAAMRALILEWAADPFFWLRLPRALSRASRGHAAGLSAYDMFLAAWAVERLAPERIYPARLPEDMMGLFLAHRYIRALHGPSPSQSATVEILNASDSNGVAWKATKILRLNGFDVVDFGNAAIKEPALRLVDRTDRPENAWTVARILGCPDAEAVTELERGSKADVTLILGQDFARCSELKPPW